MSGIPTSIKGTAGAGSSGGPKTPFFPDNIQFWYETQRAFGTSSYGGSEFGEVLATVSRIVSGDAASWYAEWNATAERVSHEAESQLTRGHRISARDGFLRAATYYRTSEFFLHGNPDDPRIYSAYEKSVAAYKASAALFDPPIQPVEGDAVTLCSSSGELRRSEPEVRHPRMPCRRTRHATMRSMRLGFSGE